MRKLKEYPVTANEAVSAVQQAFEGYTKTIAERGYGDIDGIALLMTEKFIEAHGKLFEEFVKIEMENNG